jgi:hypothetical protein
MAADLLAEHALDGLAFAPDEIVSDAAVCRRSCGKNRNQAATPGPFLSGSNPTATVSLSAAVSWDWRSLPWV